MRLRHGENSRKMEIRERERRSGRNIIQRQGFIRIKFAFTSAALRAPGSFARISFAVLGFPFSVYICTIETFYVVTRNCTFFNIILIGARAHKGACENTRRNTLYTNTRKEDITPRIRIYVPWNIRDKVYTVSRKKKTRCK